MWLKKCQPNWILQTLFCFSAAPLFSLSMLIYLLSSLLTLMVLLHLKAIEWLMLMALYFPPFTQLVPSLWQHFLFYLRMGTRDKTDQ